MGILKIFLWKLDRIFRKKSYEFSLKILGTFFCKFKRFPWKIWRSSSRNSGEVLLQILENLFWKLWSFSSGNSQDFPLEDLECFFWKHSSFSFEVLEILKKNLPEVLIKIHRELWRFYFENFRGFPAEILNKFH